MLYTPLIFFVIFVTIQFALTWHASQVASATAREAARSARVGDGLDAAEQRGRAYASQVGGNALRNVDVNVRMVDAQTVSATVSGQGIQVIPGFTLRVNQEVEGPIEEFRPDVGG